MRTTVSGLHADLEIVKLPMAMDMVAGAILAIHSFLQADTVSPRMVGAPFAEEVRAARFSGIQITEPVGGPPQTAQVS